MPKIEIDVDQILTCAVAIEAEVGDRVLVMNGVIIGMVERRKPLVVPPPPPPRTQIDPADMTTPETRRLLDEQILAVLRREGPATTRRIGDSLGLPLGQRGLVKKRIAELRQTHTIVADNASLRPAYRLNSNGA